MSSDQQRTRDYEDRRVLHSRQQAALLRAWCKAHPHLIYNAWFIAPRLDFSIIEADAALKHLRKIGILRTVDQGGVVIRNATGDPMTRAIPAYALNARSKRKSV